MTEYDHRGRTTILMAEVLKFSVLNEGHKIARIIRYDRRFMRTPFFFKMRKFQDFFPFP